MGSRAGFVVKRNGVTKAYGSRRAGSSTVAWLLRGPEKATAKFVGTGEMPQVDDVLGGEDGAALIDWDDRVVLWMMSNAQLPVYQNLCNRMIGAAFDGWDVRMAHDLYEISEYVGVDTAQYVFDDSEDEDRDWEGYSQEEIDEQLASEAEALRTTEEDVWEPMEVPDDLFSLEQIEEIGDWVTVRRADGTIKDYYGFGCLYNDLMKGERFAADLDTVPALDEIPPEMVTCDGLLIDWSDKTLWRWHLGVAVVEQQFAKKWPGWTMKQVPGGNWSGQVKLSGREPGDKATSERDLLGVVIADLVPVHATDGPSMVGLMGKTRMGCLGTTLLFAVAALAVYFLLHNMTGAIVLGVLFLISLGLTTIVYKKTGLAIKTFDLDQSPEEQISAMDSILSKLGHPSIAELNASGEIPIQDDDGEEE